MLRAKLRFALVSGLVASFCACDEFEPPHGSRTRGDDPAPAGRDTSPPSVDAGFHETGETSPDASAAPEQPSAPRNPLAFARGGQRHVFVPNPRERTLVVIDAESLRVEHARCGVKPALVAVAQSADLAVALDPDDDRACVVRVEQDRLEVTEIGVVVHANAVAFAPGAAFAIVYHDAQLDASGARLRTQDVSVIELGDEPRARDVAVGLAPREIVFSADERTALITSEAGLSSVALASAAAGKSPTAPARAFELPVKLSTQNIRLDSGATRALAFESEGDSLYVLDVAGSAKARKIDLTTWQGALERMRIADARIERSGSHAWLALRGEQTLLRVPLDEGADLAEIEVVSVAGQPSERLTLLGPDERALFVRSATPEDGRGMLVRLGSHQSVRLLLPAAGDGLLAAERGEALVVVQRAPADGFVGYSVVRTRDGAMSLRQTQAAPSLFEISSAIDVALVGLPASRGEAAALHLTRFDDLRVRVHELAADPLALGFCAERERVFVQLSHPDGRLLFVDSDDSERTLSGFLIASRVQE